VHCSDICLLMSIQGQNPNPSLAGAFPLSPAADKLPPELYSAMCHRTRLALDNFFARTTNHHRWLAPLVPKRSSQLLCRAPRRAISLPLASRCHRRGTFPAQIPIAELRHAPTEAYLPRFRALALFGRRPSERVAGSSLPASENLHNTGLTQCNKAKPLRCC
jgi:hypothetical protein